MKKGTKRGEHMKFFNEVLTYQGDDCLIWPYYRSERSYPNIRFAGKRLGVCPLICELIHGQRPSKKHQSAHSCGNGAGGCVNPRHLRWATPKENHADKIKHGTTSKGERSSTAKLNAAQVHSIRTLYGMFGKSLRKLARQFDVYPQNVSAIVNRQTWRHVP